MKTEYEPFDVAADYLVSEERIAGYLSAAAEDDDPNVLLLALCDAAKARGMMEVAKAAGLNRESLYKALKPGAHPRFETVQAVLRALGVKLAMSARTTPAEDPLEELSRMVEFHHSGILSGDAVKTVGDAVSIESFRRRGETKEEGETHGGAETVVDKVERVGKVKTQGQRRSKGHVLHRGAAR
ncbi:MAG: putative addiction module antidote protein [Hyphomicrobiales bacterium]|nr:putative addiction module antidote protein [Hyphomicrobiales bacterium]